MAFANRLLCIEDGMRFCESVMLSWDDYYKSANRPALLAALKEQAEITMQTRIDSWRGTL